MDELQEIDVIKARFIAVPAANFYLKKLYETHRRNPEKFYEGPHRDRLFWIKDIYDKYNLPYDPRLSRLLNTARITPEVLEKRKREDEFYETYNKRKPNNKVNPGGDIVIDAGQGVKERPAKERVGDRPIAYFPHPQKPEQSEINPVEGIFYHGSKNWHLIGDEQPRFDPTIGEVGTYFTSNVEAAREFGEPRAFRVRLNNPATFQHLNDAKRKVVEAMGPEAEKMRRPENPNRDKAIRSFNQRVIDHLADQGFDGIHDSGFSGAGGSGKEVLATFYNFSSDRLRSHDPSPPEDYDEDSDVASTKSVHVNFNPIKKRLLKSLLDR